MPAIKDITGQRFGRLIAEKIAGRDKQGAINWQCRCDCGVSTTVNGRQLRRGNTRSCGCLQIEWATAWQFVHGANRRHQQTVEYCAWLNARGRCRNPNNEKFADYGGRGIQMCARWESFENFLADMGRKPSPSLSLDRINNDGNYEPGNCRWATTSEQARNKRKRKPAALSP
jgi:hypothetical protein